MLPLIALLASTTTIAYPPAILEHRSLQAARVSTPPTIDGRLDEPVWATAPAATDFVQSSPRPKAVSSYLSEARVLVDDNALYVGLRYTDPTPDTIQAPLLRRDYETTSDWAFVEIDSRFDRRSGFSFGVNPAGVQCDGSWSNDINYDGTWNGVWEAAAHVDERGWTAEFRIPFSQLAFRLPPDAKELVWGINFYRRTPTHGETSNWSPRYAGLGGIVSHFNDLHVPAPPRVRRLEVTPYTASQRGGDAAVRTTGDFELGGSRERAGADFKVGVGSNFSLTGTVLPDFGQVEADPAQLNLTAFELFQSEQRPFFLEGAEIFHMQTSMPFSTRETSFANESPFYSRRIGRTGDIRGAAKLSGEAADWTLGVFSAVTEDARSTVARGIHGDTGFFFSNQNGTTIGGGDLRHRFANGAYEIRTWGLGSRDGGSGEVRFSRLSGNLTWDLYARGVSPNFNMNALGFQRNADWMLLAGDWQYNKSRPGHKIRNWAVGSTSLGSGWTWDRQPRNRVVDFYGTIDTNRFWNFHVAATHEFTAWSTSWLHGGPTLRLPPLTTLSTSMITDQRKPTYATLSAFVSRDHDDGSHSFSISPFMNVRSSRHLQWSVGATCRKDVVAWQYVGTTGSEWFVGRDRQRTISVTLRGEYIFTPQLSLQAYAQPFRTRGVYDDFQRVVSTTELVRVDATGLLSPDSALYLRNADAVLRWEYRPGSFFTAVWSNDRLNNIVLVKVSRRFGG
jgi:hypothetical protein